jgi:TRAP-type uncharacterized transport system substrate-binding protein
LRLSPLKSIPRWMQMKSFHIALPLWVRVILLAGVFCLIAGASLVSYRFYARPTTLTIAVGSFDGGAKQVASIIAGRLATIDSPVRLKVENAGNVLDAAKAFAADSADLAIVRADVGDLQQARAVALMSHGVVMIVAPPGSTITSIAKLKDHTVGVVGGEINHGIVEVLKKEYDLARANVVFKDIAPADARRAVQSKEVSALLLVVPLTDKYLSFVRGLFREGPNLSPVLIPVDSAGAIADRKGPYESFDIPKGALRGAPPVPDDDTTTLRVGYYLVANKHLNSNLVADLAKKIMSVRRDLVSEQPALSGIAAPDIDPDAYLSVHAGAAAFYNGTQESFMDKYGNAIYLTPMVLGAMASIFAAAWRFLGIRKVETTKPALDALCVLPARIRKIENEAGLVEIENEVDAAIRAQLLKAMAGDESATDTPALFAAAHRIDNLIHHRRTVLAAQSFSPRESGMAGAFGVKDRERC